MTAFAKVTFKKFLEIFKNFNAKTRYNEKRKKTHHNKTSEK